MANWIKQLLNVFGSLTGATARRSRALSNARAWEETVCDFANKHGLDVNVDVDKFLSASSELKIDLTRLIYTGRNVAEQSRHIKNKQITGNIEAIVDTMENIRRYLFSPSLQKERIYQALTILYLSAVQLKKLLLEMA